MSPLAALWRRLGLNFVARPQPKTLVIHPDCMTLRDWADLPVHHPVTDCMPR